MSNASEFTLKDVVALGEYDPRMLEKYEEWGKLSNYARFELISQGLENRRKKLFKKWGEVVNFIDDSGDPSVRSQAKLNVEEQLKRLREDKERLYLEFSKAD